MAVCRNTEVRTGWNKLLLLLGLKDIYFTTPIQVDQLIPLNKHIIGKKKKKVQLKL